MPELEPESHESEDLQATQDADDCQHRTLVLEQSGEYLTGQYICQDCHQRFVPHF